jgi:hypothetical protein
MLRFIITNDGTRQNWRMNYQLASAAEKNFLVFHARIFKALQSSVLNTDASAETRGSEKRLGIG